MEKRKLYAILAVLSVAIAGLAGGAAWVLLSAPPVAPSHVYFVEGDSEWFELPAGRTTVLTALALDNGAPVFGSRVQVSVAPDTEGDLSAREATTETNGVASLRYTAYNRTANVTLVFTFTATLGGKDVSGSTEVKQLAIGQTSTTARAKGFVVRASDRLVVPNATVQVNLLNTTGLPPGSPNFYSNNTDPEGRYVVKDIPPRTAFIQVVKAGYHSQRQDILLVAGKNTRVNFVLEQLTGKVLTVWHTYSGKEEDEFNKMVDRYRATQPTLNVVVEFQPFAGAPEKFIVSATAGNAPDVMRFQNDRLGEIAKLGYLEPLTDYLDPATIQRFTPETLAAMRIGGVYYALPATQDLLAVIYNKALFRAAGEQFPDDNWTTNDLIRIATNLTAPGRYGFVTPLTIAYYWFPWLAGYSGDVNPSASGFQSIFTVPDIAPISGDPAVALNTPESARSLLLMHSLDKVHGLMFSNPGEDPMLTEFLSGKAAMITTGPWNVPAMQRAEVDFGIAPYPVVSDTGQRARPVLGVKGFAIWKGSAVKDDAYDVLKFITAPAEQKKFSLGVGGVPGTNDIPTARAAYTDPEIQANPIIARFLYQATNSSDFPSRPEMSRVWGPMTDALTFVYQNVDPTSATAVQDAQAILTTSEREVYG